MTSTNTIVLLLEELLRYREFVQLENKECATAIAAQIHLSKTYSELGEELSSSEYGILKNYYVDVETNTLWRRPDWDKSQARLEEKKKEREAFKSIAELRKATVFSLAEQIEASLMIDNKTALEMAAKFIREDKAKACLVFGVDIAELPKLPSKYLLMMQSGSIEF